jgi:hypothetical protein
LRFYDPHVHAVAVAASSQVKPQDRFLVVNRSRLEEFGLS